MKKTEYVIAGADMRNSAQIAASVSAINFIPAPSVYMNLNDKSSSFLAGLFTVFGKVSE